MEITATLRLQNSLLAKFLIGENTQRTIIDDAALYTSQVPEFKPLFGWVCREGLMHSIFLQMLWDSNVVSNETVEGWLNDVKEDEESNYAELLEEPAMKKMMEYFDESDDSYSFDSSSDYSEYDDGSESESESASDSASDSEESDSSSDSESGTSTDESGSESERESEGERGSESESESESENSTSSEQD